MNVLVVGADGFIGGHTVQKLVASDWVHSVYGIDIKSGADAREILPSHAKVDAIVFLAASIGRKLEDFVYNLELIEALNRYVIRNPDTLVIFSSTASVYADWPYPSNELQIPHPPNMYGESKLISEFYVRQYPRHVIFRFGNVFGEGGNGVIEKFKAGGRTINGDGSMIRDYVHVDTITKCIAEAIRQPTKWHGVTNLSSGHGKSVLEIFEQYGSGKSIFGTEREGDVQTSLLDNSRMQRLLGDDD